MRDDETGFFAFLKNIPTLSDKLSNSILLVGYDHYDFLNYFGKRQSPVG